MQRGADAKSAILIPLPVMLRFYVCEGPARAVCRLANGRLPAEGP